ncbi:aminotransferase class III-fold pyridoxal phosphate-dependent enzyme [Candidatus Marinimicrobia bacterium]|nr:aminotransferase class III-fold pyridoxal phosphate-dependent enzyme [Candidatus Neomarinimicrobiota bacterium]
MLNRNEIFKLRKAHLAPSLSMSYNTPLHIVKGFGQYLYDSEGNRYLDAVNNIQHVGHSHPKIAKVAEKQFKNLNTNTRYIDETIVKYAKALTDKLPENLDVCFFTNSGSEANDLALRIARTITNSNQTIVLGAGYHGNLSSLVDISPYKHEGPGGAGAPDFVHTIPRPDKFRGKYRGDNTVDAYVSEVIKIIDNIKQNKKNVSAFMVEFLMGCGGQIVLPESFLKKTFKIINDVGGINIADEVQIGFGRMGSSFWGFETCDVIPDIVTLGKSMGNGHPIAAVVTTKEIADKFNNGMEYFNSFGGNPVSCSIGNEVLNIIEDEDLQKNALEVGSYLITQLRTLDHPLIGDIRGIGLFVGIELIKNKELLSPATSEAKLIENHMKDHGILISTDGPDHNVLKIKPPMIFNHENADELVYNLSSILNKNF